MNFKENATPGFSYSFYMQEAFNKTSLCGTFVPFTIFVQPKLSSFTLIVNLLF